MRWFRQNDLGGGSTEMIYNPVVSFKRNSQRRAPIFGFCRACASLHTTLFSTLVFRGGRRHADVQNREKWKGLRPSKRCKPLQGKWVKIFQDIENRKIGSNSSKPLLARSLPNKQGLCRAKKLCNSAACHRASRHVYAALCTRVATFQWIITTRACAPVATASCSTIPK